MKRPTMAATVGDEQIEGDESFGFLIEGIADGDVDGDRSVDPCVDDDVPSLMRQP